jgi:hypothetical protein
LAISAATVHKEIQDLISFVVLNKVYTTGILAGFCKINKIDETSGSFLGGSSRFVVLPKRAKKLQSLHPTMFISFWSLPTLFADLSLVKGFNQGSVLVVCKLYRVGLKTLIYWPNIQHPIGKTQKSTD